MTCRTASRSKGSTPILLAFALFCTAFGWSATAHAVPPASEVSAEARKAAEAHFKIGRADLVAGNFDEAITELRAAYELSHADNVFFFLGEAQRLKGNRAEALDSYQRYVAAKPDGTMATEALSHIAALTKELREGRTAEAAKAEAEHASATKAEEARAAAARAAEAKLHSQAPANGLAPHQNDSPIVSKRSHKTAIIAGILGGVVAVGAGLGFGLGFGLGHGENGPMTPLGTSDFRN